MLLELKKSRQITDENHRRWFYAQNADLIIWEDVSKAIVGFQFCYTKGFTEKAITWRQNKGLLHQVIGSSKPESLGYKMSPLLEQNVGYCLKPILKLFLLNSTAIDIHIRDFVIDQLILN